MLLVRSESQRPAHIQGKKNKTPPLNARGGKEIACFKITAPGKTGSTAPSDSRMSPDSNGDSLEAQVTIGMAEDLGICGTLIFKNF